MIEGHEGGMPPQERKKTLEREWKEVPRPYEVGIVSDLNGSFYTFIKSVVNLGYVKIESRSGQKFQINQIDDEDKASVENFFTNYDLVWAGGKKRLVFLGDIVGDRQGRGGTILEGIEKLQEQAKQEGGEITTLAGNHDIAALWLLATADQQEMDIDPRQCSIPEVDPYQKIDVKKYVQMRSTRNTLNTLELTYWLYDKKLWADPKIVALIERMKKMDLLAFFDDTLCIHADCEEQDFFDDYKDFEKMLIEHTGSSASVQEVFSAMNKNFHESLDKVFQIEVAEDGSKKVKINIVGLGEFKKNCGLFIGTLTGWPAIRKNRSYTNEFKTFLKERGINLFVHGHTPIEPNQKQDFVLSLSPLVGMSADTNWDYCNTAKILPDDVGEQKGTVEVGIDEGLWNMVRSS